MDTEYVLSSMAELGCLTPLEQAILNTHPEAYNIARRTVDENLPTEGDWMANTTRQLLRQSPEGYRCIAALLSVRTAPDVLPSIVERLAQLVKIYGDRDLHGETVASWTELMFGAEGMAATQFFHSEADVNERTVRAVLDRTPIATSLKLRLQQDVAEYTHTIRTLEGDMALQELLAPAVATTLTSEARRRRIPWALKPDTMSSTWVRKAKSAIKKATALYQSLGKETVLNVFLAGDVVTLSYPDSPFKFEVRALAQKDWLLRRSAREFTAHTPFELALLTKENVFIGNMCLYFAQSPVLDQLLGLMMYIESGEEEALLEKANFFATGHWTPEFIQTMPKGSAVMDRHFDRVLNPPAPPSQGAGSILGVESLAGCMATIELTPSRWDAFHNPLCQWVVSWLGEAHKRCTEMRVPDCLQQVSYYQFEAVAHQLLGVEPPRATHVPLLGTGDAMRPALVRIS